MKGLQCMKLGTGFERMCLFIGEQVNMALAECVVHFSDHGDQRAIGPMTEPETHRLERIATDPRKRVKPDVTISVQARGVEQAGDPRARRTSVTMIDGM